MATTISPFLEARKVYEREPCARAFEQDLDLHFKYGWVYSSPELFVMARPVDRKAAKYLIVNPCMWFLSYDCWHFYLMAGDMSRARRFLPFWLPWVSLERSNVLRFHRADRWFRMIELCAKKSSRNAGCVIP